jgi:ribonuclease-3
MFFQDIINYIKLPFRKEKELYSSLAQIIGFYPRNIQYYKQALMHKSIGRKEKGRPVNNERLEFLGDAVLDAVVGHIVYSHFPGKREGFLTNTRSKLVSRETLGRLAKEMGVLDLVLSNGRNSSHNSYMGGNAFEALVGAIYLDRGFDACMRFMEKKILKEVINIDKVAYKEVNFKSKLIEWGQKNRVKLEFGLISQEKDDNGSPKFAYEVVLEGIKGEKGEGYSKKEAQQMASKLTLQRLRKEPQFIDAIFAAKTERTKMEEEPVSVPEEEEEPSKSETPSNSPSLGGESKVGKSSLSREALDGSPKQGEQEEASIDLSLDDITVTPKEQSREDIIAAAEAAAFAEEE